MLIRSRMGISLDGFVATPHGRPALVVMPGFAPGVPHGHPEFIEGCDTVVMGRSTFLPALGAPRWPWPGKQVYVLTSSPLPAGAPADVIIARDGPARLAAQLRSRDCDGDVHLVGGPRTIRAFHEIGALDRLEIVVLPILLGHGVPLSPAGAPQVPLGMLRADRIFPDGSVELVYAPKRGAGSADGHRDISHGTDPLREMME
jgi:dihydrofolate reductase